MVSCMLHVSHTVKSAVLCLQLKWCNDLIELCCWKASVFLQEQSGLFLHITPQGNNDWVLFHIRFTNIAIQKDHRLLWRLLITVYLTNNTCSSMKGNFMLIHILPFLNTFSESDEHCLKYELQNSGHKVVKFMLLLFIWHWKDLNRSKSWGLL